MSEQTAHPLQSMSLVTLMFCHSAAAMPMAAMLLMQLTRKQQIPLPLRAISRSQLWQPTHLKIMVTMWAKKTSSISTRAPLTSATGPLTSIALSSDTHWIWGQPRREKPHDGDQHRKLCDNWTVEIGQHWQCEVQGCLQGTRARWLREKSLCGGWICNNKRVSTSRAQP